MPNYHRLKFKGGCYFFTLNLLNRRSTLLTDQIDLLRNSFSQIKRKRAFHIDAIVILPDHLHCIWTLPQGDADYKTRWVLIKSEFSRHTPAIEKRSVSRRKRGERGIWQRRFWEHWIRSDDDYARHIDYIHWNPVKHQHVAKVKDWPYSSFHSYVEKGLLTQDWLGDVNEDRSMNWGEK